jgi:hypothetical protein
MKENCRGALKRRAVLNKLRDVTFSLCDDS